MHLGLRVLAGVFLIAGLCAYFVLRIFAQEFKPAMREVMEEVMIDAAYLLADLASEELASGQIASGRFAQKMAQYQKRKVSAVINQMEKETLDFQVYVTDTRGIVVYDSRGQATGHDYSQWRDVALALKGEYGARATREQLIAAPYGATGAGREPSDYTYTYYVAAPVWHANKVIGALSVSKHTATVVPFIDRAEASILRSGRWLVLLSIAVGVLATLWLVYLVRKLTRWADEVEAGKRLPLPKVPGELRKLAQGMSRMRERLEGQKALESTVRALTHELKSPVSAIRGAGEILREPLAKADRERFADGVVEQSHRVDTLVTRMLELTKLEQSTSLSAVTHIEVASLFAELSSDIRALAEGRKVAVEFLAALPRVRADREHLRLALHNLIVNAISFCEPGGRVIVHCEEDADESCFSVKDSGPGFTALALERAGEKFFSTARTDGGGKGSGLGIAIVLQVAALHGGTLRLQNGERGAIARLCLPR